MPPRCTGGIRGESIHRCNDRQTVDSFLPWCLLMGAAVHPPILVSYRTHSIHTVPSAVRVKLLFSLLRATGSQPHGTAVPSQLFLNRLVGQVSVCMISPGSGFTS